MADRLADFWDATVDLSVAGQVTLTKLGVTVTVPFDDAKPVLSNAFAAYQLAMTIAAQLLPDENPVLFRLWSARSKHSRFVWKILSYADKRVERIAFRSSLPANQRPPITAEINALQVKADRFPPMRDQWRIEAGE